MIYETNSITLNRKIIVYFHKIKRILDILQYIKNSKFLSVISISNLLFSFSQEIPKENKTMRTISKFLTVELFVSNYIVITDANNSFFLLRMAVMNAKKTTKYFFQA